MITPGSNEHLIGSYTSGLPGPLNIYIGGLHGNEPAGVIALERVIRKLDAEQVEIKGEVVAIVGNLEALKANRRYLDRDLNRSWSREKVNSIKRGEVFSIEDEEQVQIISLFDELLEGVDMSNVHLFDLHTTSSRSVPFQSWYKAHEMGKDLELPAPVIVNIFDSIENVLLDYYGAQGCHASLFESGQHEDKSSVLRHEAYIWLSMGATGMIGPESINLSTHVRELSEACDLQNRYYEIVYTRNLNPGDSFAMIAGFENFQPISKGELLGYTIQGPIYAPCSGRIFMPLYQKDGNEAFFIIRDLLVKEQAILRAV